MTFRLLPSTLTLLAAFGAPAAAWAQTQDQAQSKAQEPVSADKGQYGSLVTPGDNSAKSRTEVVSVDVQTVGVDETALGGTVPIVPLTDEAGGMTTLAGICAGSRPVLLQLGYYRCPVICPQVLGNLGRYAADVSELRPGRDYEVVSVSIDPHETAADAKQARIKSLAGLKPELTAQGWHFMTASPESIKALTGAAGFHYNYIPKVNQYAHPDVLVVLSPKGKVVQFLSGSGYDAAKLRSALAAAAGEKVVPTQADTFWGKCFSQLSLYAQTAKRIMMAGGVLMIALVVAGFLWLRRIEARRLAAQA